jgi:endonuclease YncB( thermonuclease family)
MKNLIRFVTVAALLLFAVHAADDVVSAVHGTITKLDSSTNTVVVKTKDGTEQTVHFVDKTTVLGADKTAAGAKDSFKGLSEGSEVVVHYSEKGGEKTATEVDKVGKDGLKYIDGTVTKVGKDGKTVVVKSADGTEHTFDVAGKDTADTAKDIGKGADKAGKTTVYYTEQGGKKVAHFFEKI